MPDRERSESPVYSPPVHPNPRISFVQKAVLDGIARLAVVSERTRDCAVVSCACKGATVGNPGQPVTGFTCVYRQNPKGPRETVVCGAVARRRLVFRGWRSINESQCV